MVLKLFIGVVVTGIQPCIADELAAEGDGDESLAQEVAALRVDIAGLPGKVARRRAQLPGTPVSL